MFCVYNRLSGRSSNIVGTSDGRNFFSFFPHDIFNIDDAPFGRLLMRVPLRRDRHNWNIRTSCIWCGACCAVTGFVVKVRKCVSRITRVVCFSVGASHLVHNRTATVFIIASRVRFAIERAYIMHVSRHNGILLTLHGNP